MEVLKQKKAFKDNLDKNVDSRFWLMKVFSCSEHIVYIILNLD